MAAMNSKYSLLFLLVIGVQCLGEKCPKQCNCLVKNEKYTVDCRGKGISEVFSSDELPSRMQVLYLSRNNISVIRQEFLDDHPHLEKIYFTRNLIKTIEKRAFVGLSFLKRLVLKQNKLDKIESKAFLGLPNLDVLDISFNKITSIDKSAFYGLKRLTKLILKSNTFKSIENGTFDSLKTLKKIDLENVPLACDCHLNPFIQFLTENSIKKIKGTCLGKPTAIAFSKLKGKNLCEKPPELSIFPSYNQVVVVGDSFRLHCSTAHKTSLEFGWKKEQRPIIESTGMSISTNVVGEQQIVSVNFQSISNSDGGDYTCYSDRKGVKPKNVRVDVVSSKSRMCARDRTRTNRRSLVWPVTLPGKTTSISCPLLGNDDKHSRTISRNCSEDATWGVVNAESCRWTRLSQKLNELKNLLAQEHFRDISGLVATLKVLSEPANFDAHQDVTLVLNLLNGVDGKQGNEPFNGEVLDNILTIFNNMMDVDKGILYEAERTDQSPSRLAELITRRIVNQKLFRVLSNIVIGSVRLQKSGFEGKTCNVFFDKKNPALSQGVMCGPQRSKDALVSIRIPKTIFENLRTVGNSDDSLEIEFFIYYNSKLFPNVVSNTTAELMKGKNISSSVLNIRMANIKELNLTEPLVITFNTKAGTYPFVSYFEKEAGRTWSPSSDCHVNTSTSTTATVDCARFVNKNLAVMSLLGSESESAEQSMEIVVYFGVIIASLFLFATMVTYAGFRTLRFNRDDSAMLMNVCLSLMVVLITFAFGIDRTVNYPTCLAVGIFLHFFFLASLLWLGSYVVCVSRSLKPPKETEEVFNPVLRYYMISWGVPAVVCGITLAGDLKNYKTSEYCWLTESAGLGAFVGPACLLFIINSMLLLRLHLLLARGSSDRRDNNLTENSEEERLQTDQLGEVEPISDPNTQVLAEKSMITLNLVATWVAMLLVYANFVVAYLLIKSRHVTFTWKLLSYVYALVNIALGLAIFVFHCLVRENVREAWRKTWKTVSAKRININYGRWRTLWVTWTSVGNRGQGHGNGRILLNGEDLNLATGKSESDRQSNITLPSSAALTNDVFLNGRPLSTARVSLLDEADFPPEENTQGGAEVNEVDITEVGGDVDRPRSQASGYSGRASAVTVDSQVVPIATTEMTAEQETAAPAQANLFLPETQEENQADITDGVTSRSESSAPTAIEVSLPRTSTTSDISLPEKRPKIFTKLQRPAETAASPSSSSLSEAPGRGGQNFKNRKSNESLSSRNDSGSVGPRARKLQLLQPKYPLSGSSTHSEIPAIELEAKAKQSSESVNTRATPRNAGSSNGVQRPRNRYKDGREKPEPKQWTGNGGARIAYVSIPHVSKIHREQSRNETSV